MKRLSTLLSSVLLTTAALAQIPNPSFETWTATGSAHEATSWGSLNGTTGTFSLYTCDSGMTPVVPDGSSFIKLTSKTLSNPLLPAPIVVPGVAVTGVINVVVTPFSYNVKGGFANTTRPQSLKGKFQHMGMTSGTTSDHGRIITALTKWNSTTNSRDTVAISDTTLTGMEMSWADFTFPLTYKKGIFPDSAIILLSSSAATPVANSYLWVDNLSFFGSVASVDPLSNAAHSVAIYPNPASGHASIAFHSNNGADVMFTLSDISGKIIKSFTSHAVRGQNEIPLDLKGCAQGMYIVKIIDESGTVEKKLMVD